MNKVWFLRMYTLREMMELDSDFTARTRLEKFKSENAIRSFSGPQKAGKILIMIYSSMNSKLEIHIYIFADFFNDLNSLFVKK